jgi:hypothetical protein
MRQHGFPDARGLHGLTPARPAPGRDVAFWNFGDIHAPRFNVRLRAIFGHQRVA